MIYFIKNVLSNTFLCCLTITLTGCSIAVRNKMMDGQTQQVKPVITGLKGTQLTEEEKEILKNRRPLGVILFKHNIKINLIKNKQQQEVEVQDKEQLSHLIKTIKDILGPDCIIAVDQEGGRVQRLIAPTFKTRPAAAYFGNLAYEDGLEQAKQECKDNFKSIAHELREVGFNVNFAPVADLYHPGASSIIGDRSFSTDPTVVTSLCKVALNGMQETGICGIVKHMPGHGRAPADSHKALPIITTSLGELERTDFSVFKELANDSKLAMVAHIVYPSIDPQNPITLSDSGMQYIRNKIGFKGLIVSDAIEMDALAGYELEDITNKFFAVGGDIIVYGHGENTKKILATAPDRSTTYFKHLKTDEANTEVCY